MKQNRRMIIFIVGLSLTIFGFGMITYSFFNTSIKGDNVEAEIDIGTMSLKFSDGNPTIDEQIMVGETKTKKFTIENTGDLDASLSIEWLDIVNTYMEGSLTYTLEQSEMQDSGYTEIISKTNVPVTDTAFTTTLAPDLEIPQGKTYYYNLKITFNDLEEIDQETDRNAKLTTKFTVSQPSNNRNYTLVIDPNGGTLSDSNTVQTLTKKNGTTETIGTPTKTGMSFKGWKVIGIGSTLVDGTLTMGKTNTKIIAEWEYPIKEIIAKLGVTPKESTELDFAEPATTDEGVYSMEDDYGTSYFYRGAVTNNYVKFGGFYWRIIRVNGDGSVRIMYDGIEAHVNGDSGTDRVAKTDVCYNCTGSLDAKYVGWMYGPAGTTASTNKTQAQSNIESSNAKKVTDEWYKTNIADQGYGKYIADVLFCNDRGIPGKNITKVSWDTGLGYGKNSVIYSASHRTSFYSDKKEEIQFKCTQKNDAFTVEDTIKGNGELTYPVGLCTVDEIVAAGAVTVFKGKVNKSYYMYDPQYVIWSMSPISIGENKVSSVGALYPFTIKDGGTIEDGGTIGAGGTNASQTGIGNYKMSIKPVINLKPEYVKTMIGTGTMTDPYRDVQDNLS